MKRLAALTLSAAALWSAPSFAQGFAVEAGPGGLYVGETGHRYHRDYNDGYYRHDRGWHRGWEDRRYRVERPRARERVIVREHRRYYDDD